MKKKVFITGINGFIGGYLAEKMLNTFKYEIHGLVHGEVSERLKNLEVTLHKGDLTDFDGIGKIMEEVNPHFIIHLAARTEVEKSFYDPIDFQTVNYNGTVNLVEKTKDLSNLEMFLFASTMETYGAVPKNQWEAWDEEDPQYPNAPYAVAKKACELYLEYAGRSYNFPWAALRQTNAYGRWDNDFFVVEQFITQMLKNPDVANFGYKDPYRNFLYIDDLIDLYLVMLESPEKAVGNFFCTGPDNVLTIGELADKIADKLDWKGEINWDTKPERVGEIFYLNSTPDKAKEVLGWEPKIDLDEGLDRTIEIWKEKLSK